MVLVTAFFLSSTVYFCVSMGQLGLVVAALVFAAAYAHTRRLPILAGLCLALAAVKINTIVPNLLLFRRRSDWPTWITLGVVLAALFFLAMPPRLLPSRLHDNLGLIRSYEQPGVVNDYAIENRQSHTIIGLDRLFYGLGLSDRTEIRWLQYTGLALLGIGVVWLLARGDLSQGGAPIPHY